MRPVKWGRWRDPPANVMVRGGTPESYSGGDMNLGNRRFWETELREGGKRNTTSGHKTVNPTCTNCHAHLAKI